MASIGDQASVEDEVHRNPRLCAAHLWFDGQELASGRRAKQIRLSDADKANIQAAQSERRGEVLLEVTGVVRRTRQEAKRTVYVKMFGPKAR